MISRFQQLRCAACIFAITVFASTVWAEDKDSQPVGRNDCTKSPREVVEEFSDLLFQQKKVRQAFERWVHPDYIQHKSTLPDGREAVIGFLENLLERFPDRTFTIHRMIASDDLVAVHYHSQASPDDLGFAVVDIFRVENCLLVEHWDVVQPVPENSANDNTMF